ncbi:hypothetical protein HPB52_019894 [Rhipicephalus sanguineus]|uniref:Uncharacterized protein n=1 Tax=Rhipicephalus sanguineus TaxID=34632 RepID=A0A9D4PJN9_RHISA|nr:hypothetical protein HPB52_019894 [Rhipicephalus sanguineus]
MFAYVKYDDGYRAVLPDRLIKGFEPNDADDFSKTKKVQAHWRSEDGSTEGFYPATVHALADCLAKYVEANPKPPPGAPAEHRLAAGRKHLRSYFTEAGRCGKRPKTAKALGIKE